MLSAKHKGRPGEREQRWFEGQWGQPLIPQPAFTDRVATAIRDSRPWATGKLGGVERAILYYRVVLERETDPRRLRAYEQVLAHKMLRHAGLFPTDRGFMREFSRVYSRHVLELDCVGLAADAFPIELAILRALDWRPELVRWEDQQPDRSCPSDDARCYLPHLRGQRLLLICPFAKLLRDRANQQTFEAVWGKTGKKWFDAEAVEAVELPYGFAEATRQRYGTCLELLDVVIEEVAEKDFDVVLIAAGGLGIPLASLIKARGKVAISLGGHLQVVFGVLGERWRHDPDWQRRYFNEAWIDMPARYRPDPSETDENYW